MDWHRFLGYSPVFFMGNARCSSVYLRTVLHYLSGPSCNFIVQSVPQFIIEYLTLHPCTWWIKSVYWFYGATHASVDASSTPDYCNAAEGEGDFFFDESEVYAGLDETTRAQVMAARMQVCTLSVLAMQFLDGDSAYTLLRGAN